MEEFKTPCGRILGSLPFSYQWRWDHALHVVAVSFEEARAADVWQALKMEFDGEWDFLTIMEARESLSSYLRSAAGVFPGQTVFTLEGESGLVLFALWWPWGEEDKTSLRIGIFSPNGQGVDPTELEKCLTTWFAV